MNRYAAFLRAINVSGHNIIKMEDLRKMWLAPGIKNVTTYIQSGNVLFDANEADAVLLTHKLEGHLEKQLGYKIEVFIRNISGLVQILQSNPLKHLEAPGTMQYITFLSNEPRNENIAALLSFNNATDTFAVSGRQLYTYVVKDGSKSRFEPKFVEKKLGVSGTTRNLNTINKMLELNARIDSKN